MQSMNWQEKRKKEIDKLFEKVSQKFGITKEQIISRSRKTEVVMARRYFMNILFEMFEEKDKMIHSEISAPIKRDRTSFIHNRKEHLNHYQGYKSYRQEYDAFKNSFIAEIS